MLQANVLCIYCVQIFWGHCSSMILIFKWSPKDVECKALVTWVSFSCSPVDETKCKMCWILCAPSLGPASSKPPKESPPIRFLNHNTIIKWRIPESVAQSDKTYKLKNDRWQIKGGFLLLDCKEEEKHTICVKENRHKNPK